MEPTYEGNPNNWWQQLDGRFTLFVEWFNDGASPSFDPNVTPPPPAPISPPQPITDFLSEEVLTQLEVTRIEFDTKELYYGCPAGSELEAPLLGSTPILSTGEIDIKDIHGSTMEGMRMTLEGEFPNFEGPQSVMVVFRWNHPATYEEATTELDVDAMPGDVINRQTTVRFDPAAGPGPVFYNIYVPQLTVLWPSADFGFEGTSPGQIDASDLANLASHNGEAVEWGFDDPATGIPGPRTFQYNINPYASSEGWIDASDYSVMAAHMGHACQLSKPGDVAEDLRVILDWFGMAATGRQVVAGPSGQTIPEYAIVDSEKMRRAIADPYGYRDNIQNRSARETPWGTVKSLYR